jgi:sulfotransferase 6B1
MTALSLKLPGTLNRTIERHYILRKLSHQPLQLQRRLERWRATPADYAENPPLLANSFPKSGTHLLLQIMRAVPQATFFGSFISSMHSSLFFRELSAAETIARIDRIVPGEVLGGHIFCDPAYAEALAARQCRNIFIYRDLRDVLVSDAHYLRSMNKLHKLHRYFVKLPSIDACYMTAIRGIDDPRWAYPNIRERFARYQGWLTAEGCTALRYEDLTARDEAAFHRLAVALRPQASPESHAALRRSFAQSIRPEQSHTYRKGKAGGWRDRLKPEHQRAFEEIAGDLMGELGYA